MVRPKHPWDGQKGIPDTHNNEAVPNAHILAKIERSDVFLSKGVLLHSSRVHCEWCHVQKRFWGTQKLPLPEGSLWGYDLTDLHLGRKRIGVKWLLTMPLLSPSYIPILRQCIRCCAVELCGQTMAVIYGHPWRKACLHPPHWPKDARAPSLGAHGLWIRPHAKARSRKDNGALYMIVFHNAQRNEMHSAPMTTSSSSGKVFKVPVGMVVLMSGRVFMTLWVAVHSFPRSFLKISFFGMDPIQIWTKNIVNIYPCFLNNITKSCPLLRLQINFNAKSLRFDTGIVCNLSFAAGFAFPNTPPNSYAITHPPFLLFYL